MIAMWLLLLIVTHFWQIFSRQRAGSRQSGVVGAMGTYGRVSRYGLTAFASSLDHIGPFARTTRDAATLLEVIAGRDPLDSTAADAPVPHYAAHLDGKVRGMKIGVASG